MSATNDTQTKTLKQQFRDDPIGVSRDIVGAAIVVLSAAAVFIEAVSKATEKKEA
jgi:hypothetical protein